MQAGFLIALFIIGSCMGSYLCCQARRLRLKQQQKKSPGRRSICLSCKYKLKWYDNVPILSWLFLGGKCRKCGKKIGLAEIISELGVGIAFVIIGTTIDCNSVDPLKWTLFATTIILILLLGFLAIYDGIYGELPSLYLILSIVCATIVLSLRTWGAISSSGFSYSLILNPILAILILGGLYLVLYLISKGQWVGDGDWLLATAIGAALGHPWLALITLCLANVLALIFALLTVKGSKKSQKIHLGPFLVIAFVITTAFANPFLSML